MIPNRVLAAKLTNPTKNAATAPLSDKDRLRNPWNDRSDAMMNAITRLSNDRMASVNLHHMTPGCIFLSQNQPELFLRIPDLTQRLVVALIDKNTEFHLHVGAVIV